MRATKRETERMDISIEEANMGLERDWVLYNEKPDSDPKHTNMYSSHISILNS